MKASLSLKLPALAAGIIGCGLRVALYTSGLDAKGLPIPGHWAMSGLVILTAAALVFFLLCTRSLQPGGQYAPAYPRSVLSAVGCLIAAFAVFLADMPDSMIGALRASEPVLRVAAALCLCAVAFCRFTGRKPLFLLHGVVCLYLVLRMVCLYRFWSPDPQLIDYGFYLGAYVAMMLTCYQFAAFDADCGNHRKLWFWGLVSVYLCGVSLSGNQEPLFLLLCMIWILTNLSSLKSEPAPEETTEEVA